MTAVIAHGGSNSYRYGNCDRADPGFKSCADCRRERARVVREQLASRIARFAADPTIRPHGEANTYANWGCRCQACSDAHFKKQVRIGVRAPSTHRRGTRGSTSAILRPRPEPFGREWTEENKAA